MKVVSEKIQFPYRIPVIIFAVMIAFHAFLEFQKPSDELYLTIGMVFVLMALTVLVSCFAISKIYGFLEFLECPI
ncbi:hypothetical protein [Nitrosopumilus sp.]|uniref:hypothetical protein n=1 Tax=Nitrosopumilus sp. TaxID=2024843 RepID=UPI00292F3A77|nr:hypothetical protein [Nitrosopumilus sp.]